MPKDAITKPFSAKSDFTFNVYILFSEDLSYTLCFLMVTIYKQCTCTYWDDSRPLFIGVLWGGAGQMSSFEKHVKNLVGTCEGPTILAV